MPNYRCNGCHVYVYDIDKGDSRASIPPGTRPQDFPDNWRCHICGSDKTHLQII